jgi:hypothetical protein
MRDVERKEITDEVSTSHSWTSANAITVNTSVSRFDRRLQVAGGPWDNGPRAPKVTPRDEVVPVVVPVVDTHRALIGQVQKYL